MVGTVPATSSSSRSRENGLQEEIMDDSMPTFDLISIVQCHRLKMSLGLETNMGLEKVT